MDLAHFRMLIRELLKKDPGIVPEEAPLIVLDRKFAMYMANNGKDTKHTKHITRRMHFVRNIEKCKMQKIDLFEGCLPTADLPHSNQFCASFIFLHSLLNALSLQCVLYVWYTYHPYPCT